MKRVIKIVLSGIAIFATAAMFDSPSRAATATANLTVSASIAASCTISTSALAFGAYDPVNTHASSPLNGTGGVTITCTQGSGATVTLGQGATPDAGSSDTVPLRQMSDGASNELKYFLYQDSGRTTVWGNDAASDVARTGTGVADALTIYGQVPAAQNTLPAGSYSDTVVATVTF